MAFSGTLDKCIACDKTVYVVDQMSIDGVPYHRSCFRCSHCNGTLAMSNYSSMDGVLYCKPHFEQLFKETGSFSKKFQTPTRTKENESKTPSRFSSMFSGTQDKCSNCKKTVYPLEKLTVEGVDYHKSCFRCTHGGCPLTMSSYAALDGILYCKHHFSQLFKEKGNYSKMANTKKNVAESSEQSSPKKEAEEEEEV
ncbi:LIM domain-containing protein [Zostera marina]|uniref:LIM domain-containing protein n=1 Tax=Zostera marina TaxID=29655 RepID=A0A0K9PQF9_ZOSMR|nr:LIM domain-containing protein [Zostera marina]